MRSLLQCEYRKTRRRYLLLTMLGITIVELVWALYGDYTPFNIKNGWLMFLYQFPLYNAIFLPILSIVISSRLCDIEHKGLMLNQLGAMIEKEKLYDAKLLYGLGIVISSVLFSWLLLILFGMYMGFAGKIPWKLYLLYLLFTVVPTVIVYTLQHTLSLLFKNQAVTFFTGIIGEFCGVFALFLPYYPLLRKLFPWGYYGALQFVGMFGWSRETKMKNVYFAVMDIDWNFFWIQLVIGVLLYLIGRKLFCEREV